MLSDWSSSTSIPFPCIKVARSFLPCAIAIDSSDAPDTATVHRLLRVFEVEQDCYRNRNQNVPRRSWENRGYYWSLETRSCKALVQIFSLRKQISLVTLCEWENLIKQIHCLDLICKRVLPIRYAQLPGTPTLGIPRNTLRLTSRVELLLLYHICSRC